MIDAVEDQVVRERALDPRCSFIVQAPAGAGKTGLLIQRYLSLLAHVERPEEVLAITFTRKATAEMRARVLDALAAAAETDKADAGDAADALGTAAHHRRTLELARAVVARDRQLGWHLADAPSRLRVLTIDALCLSLSAQLPLSTGLSVPGRIVEDAEDLYRQTVRDLFDGLEESDRDAGWGASLEVVLAHLDNDLGRLEQMLVQMLVRRDQWLPFCAVHPDDPPDDPNLGGAEREQFEHALGIAVAEALNRLQAAVPSDLRASLAALADEIAASDAATFSPEAPTSRLRYELARWRALATQMLTNRGQWRARFPATAVGATARRLVEALAEEDTLRQRLHAVRDLPGPEYTDRDWMVLRALFDVLRTAAGLLQLVFAEGGAVDFIEITAAAQRALGSPEAPTDLALAIDYRLQHILVDEFQDTSHTQVALLSALSAGWSSDDGRTLFLVGDPMQSIYRFREADVSLFLRAWELGLPGVRLEPLRLVSNFRAEARLVEWANHVLPGALAPRDDAQQGAVAYRPARAGRDRQFDPGPPPPPASAVLVHAFPERQRDLEAARVVELVSVAWSRDPDSTVAVLVRTRTHLESILPALESAGLPVRGVDIEPLRNVGLIQDLLSLTRALLHPADRIAWLSVLRAPCCGLTLDDLHRLVGDDHTVAVLERLADPTYRGCLSEDGAARCEAIATVLLKADADRGRVPLPRRVRGTWIAIGGPAFAEPEHLDKAERFFSLLDELEAQPASVDADTVERRVRTLFAAPSQSSRAVDVMTIHKAKGLEFDVVIVPGLDRAPRREPPQLLAWSRTIAAAPAGHESSNSGQDALLIAPLPELGGRVDPPGSAYPEGSADGHRGVGAAQYRFIRQLDTVRVEHERGRLLYVAVTRARQELHLLAHVRRARTRDGDDGGLAPPLANSLLACLWPVLDGAFAAALEDAPRSEAVPPPMHRDGDHAGLLQRRPRDWMLPPPPASVRPATLGPAVPEATTESVAVEFLWASEVARHVGTTVHRALHDIATEGLASWGAARVRRGRAMWRSHLRGLGVDGAALGSALARVESTVSTVLEDARARWLLDSGHVDPRSEYAIGGRHRDTVVRAVIDRTFVDAAGVRWIVDYKTGRHEGGDPEVFLDRERERYRPQLERYAALMRAMDDRPIRLGLYFPALRGWREWQYAP